MIKRMFIAAAAVLATGSMFAQSSVEDNFVTYQTEKSKVQLNKFKDNWFISVGGGAQMLFSKDDTKLDFGKRINPTFDVAVGKWFTPGLGLRLMYSGLSLTGATEGVDSEYGNGELVSADGKGYYKTDVNMMNLHADVLFNLHNLIGGYKDARVWNFIPYASLGWMHAYNEFKANEFNAGVGIINKFRLCEALDLDVDVRGSFINNGFDESSEGVDCILSATVGLVYKFKSRGWKPVVVPVYNNARWNEYRGQMEDLTDENARLKTLLTEANAKKAEPAPAANVVVPDLIVTFRIGKSSLTKQDRVNLGFLAKAIKEGDANASYTITGYADKGTGSKSFNEKLSKNRAAAVYSCLVNEFGVDKNMIHVRHEGGVDNMFYNDPRLSRAAILRNK